MALIRAALSSAINRLALSSKDRALTKFSIVDQNVINDAETEAELYVDDQSLEQLITTRFYYINLWSMFAGYIELKFGTNVKPEDTTIFTLVYLLAIFKNKNIRNVIDMKEVCRFVLSLAMDGLLSRTKKSKAIFKVDDVRATVISLLQSASERCPEFVLQTAIILVITLFTDMRISSMCVPDTASREFMIPLCCGNIVIWREPSTNKDELNTFIKNHVSPLYKPEN
ncbi:hypothetical protein BDA99DRAFT_544261 [Phascolomyces articulosus]|uniref:Uncharacterized protein n=1 Tax=Phascolomyces articulosus TaxID=60185 RepID=A0AAD5P726_9FUNG|nr:hypothetical protein BDA99DRAFT_544261 [Phascolomyces articulosus]